MNGGMAMPAQGQKMEMMDHLKHVDYPASKEDLVKACENMSDVPETDKKWFMDNLPDRTYKNAREVEDALRKEM